MIRRRRDGAIDPGKGQAAALQARAQKGDVSPRRETCLPISCCRTAPTSREGHVWLGKGRLPQEIAQAGLPRAG